MLKKYLFFTLILISILGCATKVPAKNTAEEDAAQLQIKRAAIEALSESETCTNPLDCTYTPFGSKPCGGPWSYIAYSNNIDLVNFLNLVEEFRLEEEAYNIKWGAISDCSLAPEPSEVDCQDGLAVLVY